MLLTVAMALAAQPSKRPADHLVGQEIYDRSCWMCHGPTMAGDGPAAQALGTPVPDLRGALDYSELDPLIDVVLNGQGDMPAFTTEIDRPTARRVMIYMERLEAGTMDPTDHSKTPPKKKSEPTQDEDEAESDEDEGGNEQDDEGDADPKPLEPKRLPI